MKLRNKKTGEIIDFEESNSYFLYDCGDKILLGKDSEEPVYGYTTLKKFNEDWEDYEPKEPLIKDEKIRKAVRAWAEANELKPSDTVDYSCNYYKLDGSYCSINFNDPLGPLESGTYTIDELCREKE